MTGLSKVARRSDEFVLLSDESERSRLLGSLTQLLANLQAHDLGESPDAEDVEGAVAGIRSTSLGERVELSWAEARQVAIALDAMRDLFDPEATLVAETIHARSCLPRL